MAEFRLGGWLSENATQEDVGDLRNRVEARGGDLRMESYPLQDGARGFEKVTCEDLRAVLEGLEYMATGRECMAATTSANLEETASTRIPIQTPARRLPLLG